MTTRQPKPARILGNSDPEPVTILRPEGKSDVLLVCDHAGRRIPSSLNELGLTDVERSSHIAWDIGAEAVTRQLADRMDATAVLQNYSRLVIDCNRPLQAEDSIRPRSERGPIRANISIGQPAVLARQNEIFTPYHDAIRALLDDRQRAGRPVLLISIHSFTPILDHVDRPWHIGLMARRNAEFAETLARLLRTDRRLHVGMNEPYAITDDLDYTLPTHGEQRDINHVGIEIRQNLIGEPEGQAGWAGRLASLFNHATTTPAPSVKRAKQSSPESA